MTPAQSEELKADEQLVALRNEIKVVAGRINARKYRANSINQHKKAARISVGRAIRNGSLAALACEGCGSTKAEAHHDDYSKPLDVRWLCKKCHAAHHRAEKTHCANGHPWTPENIYVMPNGKRQYCVTCRQIRNDNRLDRMAEMKKLTKENLALSEEVKAAYSRITSLEWLLSECAAWFDQRADVVDGNYGMPAPNAEMQMMCRIDEVL